MTQLIRRIKSGSLTSDSNTAMFDAEQIDRKRYNSIKTRVHFRLVEQIDMHTVEELSHSELSGAIRRALQELTVAESVPLNRTERALLVSDIMNEILGLGPLEALISDDSIQDIMVNGFSTVYIEKNGILQLTPVQFSDDGHLLQIIDRIVSAMGRRVDESSPMVDARLPDGSRVNVIIPPLALNGPVLSIRKFRKSMFTMADLLESQALTQEMAAFLEAAIRSKLNVLISGGTGAGKTTLLNVLSGCIPSGERIITIEDSAELRLGQPHVIRLESRPPNIEGRGEVRLTDLVKNSLRMRPDRIIVGEVRGEEVMDMLQAMNTGHPGSMSTIHANTPKDALARMEVMAGMGTAFFSERALRGLIASAIQIVVQLARLTDGSRRIVSVSEITGIQNDAIVTQDIFRFEQKGVDENGRISGLLKGTGIRSRFEEHISSYGITLDDAYLHAVREVG